jgi:hypothetical protein
MHVPRMPLISDCTAHGLCAIIGDFYCAVLYTVLNVGHSAEGYPKHLFLQVLEFDLQLFPVPDATAGG